MKLPELTHGVSVRFFGGAESPEAEKEAFIQRAYARGFLRRGIKYLESKLKWLYPRILGVS